MDVFVAITQAKLDIKGSHECSWLQHLFQVVCDNIYKPSVFTKPCEELCFDIVNVVLERNGNKLPLDHTVLSASSLCAYKEGNYFTGKFGLRSEALPDLAQISGFNVLEERPLILLGFLTDIPTSDKTLHPEAGLFYLEDTNSAVICQLCEECDLEKYVLNNKLVLLPKWNFIAIKFPVFVFESDKGKKGKRNYLKYIEVVEDLISIQKQESAVVPQALSIQEFLSKTEVIKPDRVNIIGCLKILSSCNVVAGQKPYFLAQFHSPETDHSTSIAFWGCRFASWYNFMKIGETYVISELKNTTMNKGRPSERELLAATKHSDFYKVDAQTYTEHENTSAECDKGLELQKREEQKTDEEQMKRKQDETEKEPKATGHVKKRKQREEYPGPSTHVMPKSDVYSCSAPINYGGMITAVVNSDAGLYEIDNKFRLFTHYMPCKNFGCGMRAGASVALYHIHLCRRDQ
ncbi:CST complex subunit CTC1, partial [Paramuricea clavata]